MANNISRGERLQIMLTSAELEKLDDWRFKRRMPSRAAAIRDILRRGLSAGDSEPADSGAHSKEFGVIDTPGENL